MDTKKIIIIFILLFAAAGGYVLFAKSKKSDVVIDGQAGKDNGDGTVTLIKNDGTTITVKKPETEEVQAAQLANLKDSLSEIQKQEAAVLARNIFEDMKGWNKHNMSLYQKLLDSSKAFFLYFIQDAYPSYDTAKSFRDRLKMQNFRVVNKTSAVFFIFDSLIENKKEKAASDAADALIAKIVNRIIEFKV